MSNRLACWAVIVVVLLAGDRPLAEAQAPQNTLGCSVVPQSWAQVQQGLDLLAFGACTRHDLCYRSCNNPAGPYKGNAYKGGCDAVFYADLLAACGSWSLILSYPNQNWVDRDEFLADCADVASAGFVLVSTAGFGPFADAQRARCNANYGGGCDALCSFNCGYPCGGGGSPIDRDDCDLFPNDPDCPMCPIALDLQGNGLKLSRPKPEVYFDLDNDGASDLTSWTRMQTKDGFLVLDKNGNGTIDNGGEMFGNATALLLSASVAAHGYEALAEFDDLRLGGNADDQITAADRIFPHLRIWLDVNRDALTQPDELRTLSDLGVVAIDLVFAQDGTVDQWGNEFRLSSAVRFEDGSQSLAVDVFFARQSAED